MPLAAFPAIALIVPALAEAQGNPTVTVGAWTIATAYRADKFDSCTMNRSAGGLGISFAQTRDGLLLLVDLPKWKVDAARPTRSVSLPGRNPSRPKLWPRQKASQSRWQTVHSTGNSDQRTLWRCAGKALRCMCPWMEAQPRLSASMHASKGTVAKARRQIPSWRLAGSLDRPYWCLSARRSRSLSPPWVK